MKSLKRYLIFLFLIIPLYVHSDFLTVPYVQAVTGNSAYVLVETSTADTVTVHYGITDSCGSIAKTEIIKLTTAEPVTYVHHVKLTGLTEDTKYFYYVVQGPNKSNGSSFMTAVPPGSYFRFCWISDIRSGVYFHNQVTKLLPPLRPRFSIYGGDLCYKPDYEYWKSEFFTPDEQNTISRIPFYAVVGNHEGWEQNTKAFEHNPDSASGTQDYYSFDYGDAHFTVINFMVPYDENSEQYKFIANDLASTQRIWKIVVSHSSPYCGGGHGEDTLLKIMSEKLFVPLKVDMMISSHSHFYQHNIVDEIHYVIIGSSGAPLYEPKDESYTIKSIKDYCYGVFDVTTISFKVMVYNWKNSFLDEIRLTK